MDTKNWIALIAAIWSLLSVIVAMTPTPIDNAALTVARAVFERVSFLHPKNSPGILSLPGAPAARPFPPLDPAAVEAEAEKDGTP